MEVKDWWFLIGTVGSPFLAAGLTALMTLWWQTRREKRDAKLKLFSTLMAHRKANPPTVEWVNALNLIDLVFADDDAVLRQWHALYNILCDKVQVGSEHHQHTYINMLSAMAKSLGYNRLQQTDIDKFYSPEAYALQAAANAEMQRLASVFFANINTFIEQQKSGDHSQTKTHE